MSVSVIVPVYNGGKALAACLTSLVQATPAPDEIIVVGDGDTDGSSALAETFGARVIRMSVRRGPAHARNCGARVARGDLLFFVDADVCIHPSAIATVRSAFTEHQDISAIFGRYDDSPTEQNFLSQYKNLLHHHVHTTARDEASTFWTACGAIRREVFTTMGGFDVSYDRPCIEDIELGYRLRQAGHRILVVKDLQVTHMKRWSVRSLLETDFAQRALPWAELILERRSLPNDLNTDLSSRISVICTYGLLASLVGALWFQSLIYIGIALAGSLVFINRKTYKFFFLERGLWFTMRVLPWHWLYYAYSGLAFAIALVRWIAINSMHREYAPVEQLDS